MKRSKDFSGRRDSDVGTKQVQRRKPEILLETVHQQALLRESNKKSLGHSMHTYGASRVTDEMIERRMRELSVEDARELAFQAKEQMRTLAEVSSRVKNAMSKAKDLDLDVEETDESGRPVDAKKWLGESRRYINGAIFRYNESCLERNEALNGFCDWFELYENIWPLPLVSSDVQYNVLLGGEGKDKSEDVEGLNNLQDLWPQMGKIRNDLGKIMSVTSEMGQKALNAELRAELKRLANEISDRQTKLELSEKNVKLQKDQLKAKDSEIAKMRQMNEVQLKRRDDEIKQLKDEMAANKLQYEQTLEKLKEEHAKKVAKITAEFEAFKVEAEKEATYLKKVIEEKSAKIAALEHEIEGWKVTVAEKEDEIKHLKAEISTLNEEIEIIKIQLSQVTAELAAERESPLIAKLEARIADLEGQVEKLTGALAEANETIKIREGEIVMLKKQIEEGKMREKEMEAKISNLTTDLAATKAQMEALRSHVSLLEEKLKITQAELAARLQDIQDMEGVFAKEREELKKAADVHKKKADELESLLKESRALCAQLQSELKAAKEELVLAEKRREEEEKAAALALAAVVAEREGLQAELQSEREEFARRFEEVVKQHAEQVAGLEATVSDLAAFKAEVESHHFEDRAFQTDMDSFYREEGSESQGAGGTGQGLGTFSGGEMMRKKFVALKERVLDVRGEFDKDLREFKVQLLSAITTRSSWQRKMDSDVAVLAEQLSKTLQAFSEKKGSLDAIAVWQELQPLFRVVDKTIASCTTMAETSSGEGGIEVVHRMPKTLSEIERVLEGINSLFTDSSVPLQSDCADADVERPTSASIRKLRPLIARTSALMELHMAEGLNDFSKYNTLRPMDMSRDKSNAPPPPSEARAQEFFDSQRLDTAPVFPRRPSSSHAKDAKEDSLWGPRTPERSRRNTATPDSFVTSGQRGLNPLVHDSGIAFGLVNTVSDMSFSYTPGPASPTGGLSSSLLNNRRTLGDTALSAAPTPAPNAFSSPDTYTHHKSLTERASYSPGEAIWRDNMIDQGLKSMVQRDHETASERKKPMTPPPIRRGNTPQHTVKIEHMDLRSDSVSPGRRMSRVSHTEDDLTQWKQWTQSLPPEIEPKVGVQWAATADCGLATPMRARTAGSRSFMEYSSGVIWSSGRPVPAEKQRWILGSTPAKGKMADPKEVHSIEDVSQERMAGAKVEARPKSARQSGSVQENLLQAAGAHEGLRPGKVFKPRPHTDRPSHRVPARESTPPVELLHPVLEHRGSGTGRRSRRGSDETFVRATSGSPEPLFI